MIVDYQDDTKILRHFIRFYHFFDCSNQTSITSVRNKIFLFGGPIRPLCDNADPFIFCDCSKNSKLVLFYYSSTSCGRSPWVMPKYYCKLLFILYNFYRMSKDIDASTFRGKFLFPSTKLV